MEKAFPDTFGCRSSGKDDSKNVGSDDVVQAVVGELISPASSSSRRQPAFQVSFLFFFYFQYHILVETLYGVVISKASLFGIS